MERSLAGQLRGGMAVRDGASEALFGLWLQCAVLVAGAVFALALSLLDRLLPTAENGPALAALLVDSALFVPAVILGVAGGLWPLRAVLAWKGVGPRAVAVLAPLGATAVLSMCRCLRAPRAVEWRWARRSGGAAGPCGPGPGARGAARYDRRPGDDLAVARSYRGAATSRLSLSPPSRLVRHRRISHAGARWTDSSAAPTSGSRRATSWR